MSKRYKIKEREQRRIYGNKTERTNRSELQLSLGYLLATEEQLQKQLDEAVAKAREEGKQGDGAATPPSNKPKATPKSRRDLLASHLPRVPLELLDPRSKPTRQEQTRSRASPLARPRPARTDRVPDRWPRPNSGARRKASRGPS
jgi:hypothetical protein